MSSIPKPEETAIVKLDKLLDEYGIEHDYPDKKKFYGGGYIEWQNADGIKFRASNACMRVSPDEFARKLIVHMVKVTPEQAIAATLGRGTCELAAFADVPFNVDYEIEGYDSSSGNDCSTLAECSKSLVRQRMRLADLEWAVRFMAPILLCSHCDGVSVEEWAKLCGILFDTPDAKFRIPEGYSLPCEEGGISTDKCWECVSRNVKFNQLAGLEDE